MPFSEALRESSNGVIIDLEVTPGSRIVQVPSGYNSWRKRIEVKLTQAAQKGKANQQLLEKLSEIFGIGTSDIIVVSGQTSHKKAVHIRGMSLEQVIVLLTPLLEND
ncbi:MAG TPA: DUF167 domain-containing protein [Candidatus Nanoarchaeia archaeon]|nr:DUF167 domain-containing protein [Candidatus Nanoarchaeia archaeon]